MSGKWMVDYAHSAIGFEVTHMMVSKVRGQFDSFEMDIKAADLTDLTTAEIHFTFAADSINTRHLERDTHLKSADFFDAHTFPTLNFSSTTIVRKEGVY